MIGDSYNYFYSSGQSAGQIIRQNVTMNALRSGIQSYAARSGDTASLVNMANTSSLEKQRLAQATMGHQALRTPPLMQTVIMGIMIGMFPIMVMAAMFNMMTLQVLKGYVFALIWLQTWPLLFAILNSAMAYYAKQNGVPVVLSELSQVQLKNSDIATTAGYIAVMIPPLSWGDREEHGSSLLQCLQPFFLHRGSVQHRRLPPAWWTAITLSPTCRWRTSAATAGVPTVQPVSDRCHGSWRMGA